MMMMMIMMVKTALMIMISIGEFKSVPCGLEIGVEVDGDSDGAYEITEEDVVKLDDDAGSGRHVLCHVADFEQVDTPINEFEVGTCNAYIAATVRPQEDYEERSKWSCEFSRRPFQARTLLDVVRTCTEQLREDVLMDQRVVMNIELQTREHDSSSHEDLNRQARCVLIGHDRLDRHCGSIVPSELMSINIGEVFNMMPYAAELAVVLTLTHENGALLSYRIADAASGDYIESESNQLVCGSMVLCQFSRRVRESEK